MGCNSRCSNGPSREGNVGGRDSGGLNRIVHAVCTPSKAQYGELVDALEFRSMVTTAFIRIRAQQLRALRLRKISKKNKCFFNIASNYDQSMAYKVWNMTCLDRYFDSI